MFDFLIVDMKNYSLI